MEDDDKNRQFEHDNNVIEMHPNDKNVDNEDTDNNEMASFSNIRHDGNVAAVSLDRRTLIGIGWISAALTAFVSPYFAFLGVLVGVLANRQVRGSGNTIIIINIVLAAINILFGFFLILSMRRMFFGI